MDARETPGAAGAEQQLVAAARGAHARAYAPYSKFHVGAAVRAGNRIYAGCNVENASYGLTICAERAAAFSAISSGERRLDAVAIVTDTAEPTPPCGACRQVLREFGADLTVISATLSGKTVRYSLGELLPVSFGPDHIDRLDQPGHLDRSDSQTV
jgi:cytidine deaminase